MDHPEQPTPVEQFAKQSGYQPEQIVDQIRSGERYGEVRNGRWFVTPKPQPTTPPGPMQRKSTGLAKSGAATVIADFLCAISVASLVMLAAGVAGDHFRFRTDERTTMFLAPLGCSVCFVAGLAIRRHQRR